MDDSERGSSVESVPIGGLRHPLEVVFQEGIVGGISIHHGIGPNGSTMKD